MRGTEFEALTDGLAALDAKILGATTNLAELRDQAERSESASAIRAAAAHVADARDEAGASLRHALDAARSLVSTMPVNPDLVSQLNALAETFLSAVAGLIDHARSVAAQTESGHAPMHRASPPPPPELPVPVIERMRVYCLSPIRWREGEQVRTASRYTYAELPRELATLAIARSLADQPDSPRARNLIDTFGLRHTPAHPDDCIDLDAIGALQPPTMPTDFIETVGVARIGTIGVG